MRTSIIILIVLFFFGCTAETEETLPQGPFSQAVPLQGETLLKSDQLKDPWAIAAIGDYLIVGNLKGEPTLELYTLEGELVRSLIEKGKGPNEISAIGTLQVDHDKEEFYVYDLHGKKIMHFNLEALLTKEDYRPNIYVNLSKNEQNSALFDKVYVTRDYLLGESRSADGRFVFLENDGTPVSYAVNYPEKTDEKLTALENAYLYSGGIAINPEKNRVAFATYMAGMLDIYEVDKANTQSVFSHFDFAPCGIRKMEMGGIDQVFYTKKSRTGYLNIASTSQYIYALYSGKRNDEDNYAFGTTIRTVDWDGTENFEYQLNYPLKRLTVSPDDATLYGIALNTDDEPEVVKFNLR